MTTLFYSSVGLSWTSWPCIRNLKMSFVCFFVEECVLIYYWDDCYYFSLNNSDLFGKIKCRGKYVAVPCFRVNSLMLNRVFPRYHKTWDTKSWREIRFWRHRAMPHSTKLCHSDKKYTVRMQSSHRDDQQ